MFKVFSGDWRGAEADANLLYIQVAFDFRSYLCHFKGPALSVLLCLALHMDEKGQAFPAYDLIQAETGLARDSVGRAIKQLCSQELNGRRVLLVYRVRDEHKRYVGGNHYILFPTPSELAAHEAPGAEPDQEAGMQPANDIPSD